MFVGLLKQHNIEKTKNIENPKSDILAEELRKLHPNLWCFREFHAKRRNIRASPLCFSKYTVGTSGGEGDAGLHRSDGSAGGILVLGGDLPCDF